MASSCAQSCQYPGWVGSGRWWATTRGCASRVWMPTSGLSRMASTSCCAQERSRASSASRTLPKTSSFSHSFQTHHAVTMLATWDGVESSSVTRTMPRCQGSTSVAWSRCVSCSRRCRSAGSSRSRAVEAAFRSAGGSASMAATSPSRFWGALRKVSNRCRSHGVSVIAAPVVSGARCHNVSMVACEPCGGVPGCDWSGAEGSADSGEPVRGRPGGFRETQGDGGSSGTG